MEFHKIDPWTNARPLGPGSGSNGIPDPEAQAEF
jgi:hypothetical protein